jgi:hypothetical protein
MVAPLETLAFEFLTAPSQAPKVFTRHGVPGEGGLGTHCLGPHDLPGAMVPRDSLAQTHLTRVRPRELLCFRSSALRS